MINKIKIIGIAGSLRKKSTNRGILRTAIALAQETLEIEIVDISEIPSYNADGNLKDEKTKEQL